MPVKNIKRLSGDALGLNRFDARQLTPALAAFLSDESQTLNDIFKTNPYYNHLIEVGCGYGRYLHWAVTRGLSYDGLEETPWFMEMAEVRLQRLQSAFPNVRGAIHAIPASKMGILLENTHDQHKHRCTLAFFPFNSFGVPTTGEDILKSLYHANADVVVSAFKPDAASSEIYAQYYSDCGYSDIQFHPHKLGQRFFSNNGPGSLNLIAYEPDLLIQRFKKNGFILDTTEETGTIGTMYHFKTATDKHNATQTFDPSDRRYRRETLALPVTLEVLEEKDLSRNSSQEESLLQPDSGRLLEFHRDTGVTQNISAGGLLVTSNQPLEGGMLIRVSIELSEANPPLFLVALVQRCEQRVDGKYDTALRFSKPHPELADLLERHRNHF